MFNSKRIQAEGVYIYGGGEMGLLALEYCERCHIPIHGVLDSFKQGVLTSGSGVVYQIFNPFIKYSDDAFRRHVLVAVVTVSFDEIKGQLCAAGWESIYPFYDLTYPPRAEHPLSNGWSIGVISDSEKEMMELIKLGFGDEQSRLHYDAFVQWHLNKIELSTSPYPIDPGSRYAIPEVLTFLRGRCIQMVDVGAHHAESVIRLSREDMIFQSYVLFEPDPISFYYLESSKNLYPYGAKVQVMRVALSDSVRKRWFSQGLGYCSQFSESGSEELTSRKLDEFHLEPDFLKIHTEGSELEVLRGSVETIARYRPLIAYSVYHRRAGFLGDILEPMTCFEGYDWFLRLHGFQGTGAFVYGVPTRETLI
jgi:FkbM family methyltransferase